MRMRARVRQRVRLRMLRRMRKMRRLVFTFSFILPLSQTHVFYYIIPVLVLVLVPIPVRVTARVLFPYSVQQSSCPRHGGFLLTGMKAEQEVEIEVNKVREVKLEIQVLGSIYLAGSALHRGLLQDEASFHENTLVRQILLRLNGL